MNLTITNQNVYVVSDVHNDFVRFQKLLKTIGFSDKDILIVDGDLFDRGHEPVELYFEILKHPNNIYVVQGNHDVWVRREIEEIYGGGASGPYISYNTVEIMQKRLTEVDLLDLAKWISEKPYYINLELDGKGFQISHAETYPSPERVMDWSWFYMGDFHHDDFLTGKIASDQFISVVGHMPTEDGRIWKSPNGRVIRIDCGCGLTNYHCKGQLGAIRLNDLMEFYV